MYAVTARLDGIRPTPRTRVSSTAATVVDRRPADVDPRDGPDPRALAPPIERIELVGVDRWARVSELWGQVTFYLFDAEGWR